MVLLKAGIPWDALSQMPENQIKSMFYIEEELSKRALDSARAQQQ